VAARLGHEMHCGRELSRYILRHPSDNAQVYSKDMFHRKGFRYYRNRPNDL